MSFAKTLKKLRTKAKMTGYALARESRVDPTSWLDWKAEPRSTLLGCQGSV